MGDDLGFFVPKTSEGALATTGGTGASMDVESAGSWPAMRLTDPTRTR